MTPYSIGDVLAGKYEIKAVLGAGGMGTVYRARQIDLGRDVAIKVPIAAALEIPGFLQRFSREAKTVAKLTHDNIVQVYEYQESADQVYIVMEFVEGRDLKNLIEKPPADLSVKDIAVILKLTGEGLAHAHEHGIVHRDIKPHNIMVQHRGPGKWRVKIMDFGIAHLDANSNLTMQQENLTVTGQAIGTPSYMSPEQIRGTGVTARSDIYSFGCVIYFCFSRHTPFVGTGFTVAAAHLSDIPPPIRHKVPALPEEFEALVNQCLEKDPANRPGDASELGQRLLALLLPMFDKPMAEVWPPKEGAAALPPGSATVMDDATDASPRRSSDPIPVVRSAPASTPQMQMMAPTRPMDAMGGQQPVPSSLTAPTIVTGMTAAPTAMIGQTQGHTPTGQMTGMGTQQGTYYHPTQTVIVPAQPEKSIMMPLMLGVLGLAVASALGVAYVVGRTNNAMAPQPTPTPAVTMVAAIPTPEPATSTQPQATPAPDAPPPTPSPVPQPTKDPVEVKLVTMERRFKDSRDWLEKVSVWKDIYRDDAFGGDPRMLELAKKVALEIAAAPELSAPIKGTFTMGSSKGSPDEGPPAPVTLSPYRIGTYEVTAFEYATFLNALARQNAAKAVDRYLAATMTNIEYDALRKTYAPKKDFELHPANGVTWQQANEYATWLAETTGKRYRIPREAEWERAAKGEAYSQNAYPWGSDDPKGRAQFGADATVPVNANPDGKNTLGLYNMAGNVREWCFDWYSEKYDRSTKTDPKGPAVGEGPRPRRVCRGGSFASPSGEELRVTSRASRLEPEESRVDAGFRIVLEEAP